MRNLTKDERRALSYLSDGATEGPAPGWNADCEMDVGGVIIDGTVFQALFNEGLLEAKVKEPPHSEDFDEESGSIVRDHLWFTSDAGRAALSEQAP